MVFFFQAEDGIRDIGVTGVQTCALPIFPLAGLDLQLLEHRRVLVVVVTAFGAPRVVDRLGGEDLLTHEVPHPAADVLGSGGEGEVHERKVEGAVTGVSPRVRPAVRISTAGRRPAPAPGWAASS